MTSPGGPGARPGELFMEKAGSQAQQPLSRLRCGGDKASSWPNGAARAGRADEGAGWLEEAANWWGGRAPWSLPGGERQECLGSAFLESTHPSPPLLWVSLRSLQPPNRGTEEGGSSIHNSETRWAQKRQPGDFSGSALVHVRACACTRGWGVCFFISGAGSLPGSLDADGHPCTS